MRDGGKKIRGQTEGFSDTGHFSSKSSVNEEGAKFKLLDSMPEISLLKARFISFSYSPHSHEEFAIGQTLEGFQDFRCRGDKHRGYPGSFLIINPGAVHDGHSGLESGFSYRMLYVSPHFMSSLAREIWGHSKASCHFSDVLHRSEASLLLLNRLFDLLEEPSASPLKVQSAITWSLACLLQRHGECRIQARPTAARCKIIQDAQEFLRENVTCNITLEELAERFDDTPYRFLRRFGRQTGLSPHRFLTQCRVERAKQLIHRGTPLSEVALASGFCDQSHLNRRFREVCGISPGAFRLAIRLPMG